MAMIFSLQGYSGIKTSKNQVLSVFCNYKLAMTLAEVLITLCIIGVVAAMTISTLINKTQERQFKEAAKGAYSKASQAIQQMKTNEGESLEYYQTTANSFKPVFITYFKVIKDCDLEDCVAGSFSSTDYKSLSGDGAWTMYMTNGQFITNDGMFWGISNNGTGLLMVTVDVNGYMKGPNVFGRDTFMFQLLYGSDKFVPMGGIGTSISLCDKTTNGASQGLGCMIKVIQGIDYAY